MRVSINRKIYTLFMAVLLCVSMMANCSAADNNRCVMEVSGTGKATAVPDRAVITLGVTSYNKEASTAQQDNARRAAAVQTALEGLGIEPEYIRTQDYSFNPRYSSAKNKTNEIIGYTVNNSVVVTIDDISKVSRVIDLALNNGANKVNALSYSLQDSKALRNEALANAIADAQSKANVLANGLGVRIAGVQHINENSGTVQPYHMNANLAKMASASDSVATPVSAGTLDVEATVSIEYIIE